MASDPEIVLERLDQVFASLKVLYVVGGSVASSVYGVPRTTQDIDILADLKLEQAAALVEKLKDQFYVDLDGVRDAIVRKASFNVIHLATMHKADIFVATTAPWAEEEMSRSRRQTLSSDLGASAFPLSSPEDNILHKLRWFELGGRVSEKQWNDVLGVLRVQAGALDYVYLREWAEQLGLASLLDAAIKEAGN